MYKHNRGWHLFLRSLWPSVGSLVGSLIIAIFLISLHMFLLSNDQSNLLLPHLTGVTNDQLSTIYQNSIQKPLDEAFASPSMGVILTAVVWGAAGWIVYSVADFLVLNYKEIMSSGESMTFTRRSKHGLNPLRWQVLVRILWRFFTGILFIVFTVWVSRYITRLFANDVEFLRSDSPLEMIRIVITSLAGWLLIFHAYVVLIRLFVLRTRVFGEIIF